MRHPRWFAAAGTLVVVVGVLLAGPPARGLDGAALADVPDAPKLGRQLFMEHCAVCHGADARGSGPMASVLRVWPADLTTFASRNGGVFPSERVTRIVDGRDVASHGSPEMPVWGLVFQRTGVAATDADAADRIAAIVQYLAGIQQRTARLHAPARKSSHF